MTKSLNSKIIYVFATDFDENGKFDGIRIIYIKDIENLELEKYTNHDSLRKFSGLVP